jgi:hypothetical protein
MRTFILLSLLAIAGCGGDDTTSASAADLAMHLDLSGQPTSCGATGVAQSCATASGASDCFVCDLARSGGLCARVCSLLVQDCPTGQTCTEFTFADAGMSSSVAVEGSGCGIFGYCR